MRFFLAAGATLFVAITFFMSFYVGWSDAIKVTLGTIGSLIGLWVCFNIFAWLFGKIGVGDE